MSTEADGWGVFGQEHAVSALRHALRTGRLAHAYLLGGPPGAGKATLARRLAQALMCERAAGSGDAPCLECRTCRQVEAGEAPDVERVAIGGPCDGGGAHDHSTDGSTRIRICQVRRVERLAALAPFRAARRIFVIDTADDLQPEAAHALLKTLEEPPGDALLLLLAADVEALLPTIRSRCQALVLRPMSLPDLAEALRQTQGLDAEAAEELAREALGRYGLALRLHQDPSLRVLRETAVSDMRTLCAGGRNERFDHAEQLARMWLRERESVLATLDVWRSWWRQVLHSTARRETPEEAEPAMDGVAAAAEQCSPRQALRGLSAVQRARDHLLRNTNAQLALEVLMLDLPVLRGEEARPAAASRA